jgi:antitoxin component YwqK of YwqJK toxin-antitoxin module
MIVYGTGEKKLASAQYVKCKCPQCGEFEITFHFFKKYFHLFWIPTFPLGTRQVAYCEKCHVSYQESIPSSLTLEVENARRRTSTPIYLFSGLAILVIGISSIVFLHDGKTTYYYPSSYKQAVGKLVNDKQDGKWTYWFENGPVQSEQYYKNGVEDSIWSWYNKEGIKTKEGGYRKGMYHGKWLFYSDSGALLEEDLYVDNRKHGKTASYFENGKKSSEVFFERDREHGPATYWFENGNKFMEGSFENGVKTGIWKTYFENGKLNSETRYENSKEFIISLWDKDGVQLVKDGSGSIVSNYDNQQKRSEGKIRNGQNDGAWNYWFENGSVSEQGIFDKGVYTLLNSWDDKGKVMVTHGNGYHKTFYDNGIVATECMYRNGKANGLFLSRSSDNTTLTEVNYKDGKYQGKAKFFFETGELNSEGTFVNNLQEGIYTWYHTNGKKEAQVNFVHDKKEGEETFWSESGEVVKREFYENGKLLKEEAR